MASMYEHSSDDGWTEFMSVHGTRYRWFLCVKAFQVFHQINLADGDDACRFTLRSTRANTVAGGSMVLMRTAHSQTASSLRASSSASRRACPPAFVSTQVPRAFNMKSVARKPLRARLRAAKRRQPCRGAGSSRLVRALGTMTCLIINCTLVLVHTRRGLFRGAMRRSAAP